MLWILVSAFLHYTFAHAITDTSESCSHLFRRPVNWPSCSCD
uniref:Uncharacterized protein n=1 Tax=Anguilla anguilla TaxID=7936 RepID=A0A0E9VMR8_ANGAN